MSQAGNIGGLALADVLTGNEMPSGHLTTTWAENYEDYPCSDTFSHVNGDVDDEYYREGIYVGYRWFDSFGITPAYPFGYGLSYTTFDVQTQDVSLSGDTICVRASVRNTGDTYRGREVVQVYYSAPEGAVEKPWQELAAYAKTGILAPGEEEVLTMNFPAAAMASYDESRASYVLDPGIYYIRVGVHSRATHVAAAVTLDAEAVTARLSNRLTPDCEMDLLSAKGAAAYTYEGEEQEKASAVRLTLSAAAIGCLFLFIEFIVSGCRIAVTPLAGISGDDIDRCVRITSRQILIRDRRNRRIHKLVIEHFQKSELWILLHVFPYMCEIYRLRLIHKAVIGVEPGFGCNLVTGGFKPLLHIDDEAAVDVTGTGSALDRPPGAVAEQSKFHRITF